MANFQLIGPMPDMTLAAGMTVTWEAIDPDTGAAVTGVTVSQAAVYGVNIAPDYGPTTTGDPLPPLYVSLDDEPTVTTEA